MDSSRIGRARRLVDLVSSRVDSRRTVLLVDDHEGVRRSLREVLELSGYRVEIAEHGLQGIEQLRRVEVHIVILDMDMPVMDGRGFLATVALDARLARVPVVVYSASPLPAPLPAGVRAWIWKGSDVCDVLSALARLGPPPAGK